MKVHSLPSEQLHSVLLCCHTSQGFVLLIAGYALATWGMQVVFEQQPCHKFQFSETCNVQSFCWDWVTKVLIQFCGRFWGCTFVVIRDAIRDLSVPLCKLQRSLFLVAYAICMFDIHSYHFWSCAYWHIKFFVVFVTNVPAFHAVTICPLWNSVCFENSYETRKLVLMWK